MTNQASNKLIPNFSVVDSSLPQLIRDKYFLSKETEEYLLKLTVEMLHKHKEPFQERNLDSRKLRCFRLRAMKPLMMISPLKNQNASHGTRILLKTQKQNWCKG